MHAAPAAASVLDRRRFSALVAGTCLASHFVRGDEPDARRDRHVASRDELLAAVAGARPGDRILVAPGTYRGGLRFERLRGEPGRPIVLGARDPNRRPVFEGGAAGLHLLSPEHVEVRDWEFTGATSNGVNVDDEGAVDSPAHDLTLAGLHVHDVGPRGNRDGLKLSGVDRFLIRDCRVERWGESGSAIDLVGCHDGEVLACEFRHRGDLPANGVQIKGGSARVAVRRCRFDQAGGRAVNLGGSTGADYFRPRTADCEARDLAVEDCTFLGSMAPVAFVGSENVVVRHNTLYRPTRWVVRILQESRGERFLPCRRGEFSKNLIVFRSDELRTAVNVGEGVDAASFRFDDNHWYCQDAPRRSVPSTAPVRERNGRYGEAPRFVDERQFDLRQTEESPARAVGVRPRDA